MSETQNRWCVPFALAFISGRTPNEVAAAIKTFLVDKCRENAKRYTREAREHAKAGDEFKAQSYKQSAASAARLAASHARKPVKGVHAHTYAHADLLAALGLKKTAEVYRPSMSLKSWC